LEQVQIRLSSGRVRGEYTIERFTECLRPAQSSFASLCIEIAQFVRRRRLDHANPQTPAQKVAKFRQHIRTEIGTAGVHRIGEIQYRMIPEQPGRRNRYRGHANILGLTPVSWSVERLGSGYLIWWHVALPFRDIPWFGPWQSHSSVPTPTMLGLLGAAAIVFSAVAYSLGSVVARPLTKTTNATFLSGLTMLPGGLILTIGAWAFKPGAKAAAWFDWSAAAWGGWLFLVILARFWRSPSICG
jgi:hypothetical protein